MAEFKYDNGKGGLFLNNKKDKDKAPDYTGMLTQLDGTEVKIAGWVRQTKKGNDYLSLSLSEKTFQQQEGASGNQSGDVPY